MGRARHADKHIDEAVDYAVGKRWVLYMSNGHAWGHLLCPNADRGGCRISVWSTPKGAENHAKNIRKLVDKCSCKRRP